MLKKQYIVDYKMKEKKLEEAREEVERTKTSFIETSVKASEYIEVNFAPKYGEFFLTDKETGKTIHLHAKKDSPFNARNVYWYENGKDTKIIKKNSDKDRYDWARWLLFNS